MRIVSIIQYLLIALSTTGVLVDEGVAQVAVIAHPAVPIDSISKTDLYDLYAFEIRKWGDGQPVVVFDIKQQGDLRKNFYNYLGKSPSRMKSIWLVHKLSGEGEPPEALATEEAMMQRVAETPGAIGFTYLPVEDATVKVLTVIE